MKILDEADRRILRVLQEDGRISNVELSERCAMSASACLDRTRRLRDRGYIRNYVALLDPQLLDQALLIFVEVTLDRTSGDIFTEFADSVQREASIGECHMVAGGFDYLLKVRMKDMQEYRDFLTRLAAMPGVRGTRSYPAIEDVKCTTTLPV
jgi:Lrp/AsnC family leucine-responsive transcriptional regulator